MSNVKGRTVAELFAGVGGFRRGLEPAGWRVAWSNQWEPSTRKQHASDCYVLRFGPEGHSNEDIAEVLDRAEQDKASIPDVDLLVGGFPCQDYSVAKPLSQASGLIGQKGVLWWEIRRFLELKRPKYLFLENVDRLLKSPAARRGRDFAVMLACLSDLGYAVEWRVANAADYGFPQRRRRVFVVGRLLELAPPPDDAVTAIYHDGVLARALPVESPPALLRTPRSLELVGDLHRISQGFGEEGAATPFGKGGVMWQRHVWTDDIVPCRESETTLEDILLPDEDVPTEFFITRDQLKAWRYLKGAKKEPRQHRDGWAYNYSEGAIPFPDPVDRPSRTILTGEGGSTPSRFKHVVEAENGRYRRLTPVELERLNGFPDDWTDIGIPAARRAFLMGNALVVGLVERVGRELASAADRWERKPRRRKARPEGGSRAEAAVLAKR